MAWNMTGQMLEACSCKLVCPCLFGPADPDRGWCSAALTFDIQQGNSDGVSLGGRKVVWAVDLPGDFVSGNGTARLYVDDGAGPEQRRELEAIFTGKKGGPWEAIGASVTKWLPTKAAKIELKQGDSFLVSVAGAGEVRLQLIKGQDGSQAKIVNAPINAPFGINSEDLARSDGGSWADPDMRRWEAGGSGGVAAFSWKV